MEVLITNMTLLLGVIGILAFTVSIVVQVFKGVSVLKKSLRTFWYLYYLLGLQ